MNIYQNFRNFTAFLQNKYSLRIIYLCQSGSRLHRTSTYQSDHDLKGITRSSKPNVIRSTAISFKGIKNKIDIQLIPFQVFLNEVQKGESPVLRWVNSDIVYIDKIQNFKELLTKSTDFPVGQTSERVAKDLLKASNNGLRKAKKLLNMIIDTLLIYYVKLQGLFPPMDVSKLLQFVKPLEVVDHQALQSKVEQILQMKQTGRSVQQIQVGQWLVNFSKRALEMPLGEMRPKKLRDQCIKKLRQIVGKL